MVNLLIAEIRGTPAIMLKHMTHRVFLEFLNVHTALPPSIYFSSQIYHVRSPEHFKANGIASYTIFYGNGFFLLYNIVNEKREGISPSPASLIAD